MKKLLLIVGIILISFSLATAAYAATLNYTVSATTIETGTDFTATFSITLPEHEESYAGFEITIKLPEGGDLRNVNYGTNQGNAVTPQQDSSGSWHIFRFDLTNVFKNSIVVTFVIDYIAETPGTIVIEEVTTVRLSGVGMTDTYIGGPTNITINPYIPTLPTFSIVASASPLAGGSVTGGGTFEQGADVTLTATANSGYVFEGWFEGEASVWEQATYAFKAAADRTLVARFKVEEAENPTYVISVSASPLAGGSVTGGGTYAKDADVTLTATANSGYVFEGWFEGEASVSAQATYAFKAAADRTLVARFKVEEAENPTYVISVSASPLAGGSVTGGGTYAKDADVTLTATANSGYEFEGWFEGEASVSAQATYAFKAAADRTLVARFKVEEVVVPTFVISVSASPEEGGSVSGGGTFEQDADVTLTATANSGYEFEGWFEGGTGVSAQATYAFKAAADRTLVARFKVEEVVVPTFVISVSVEPENGGSVTGGGEYDKDADVTLTAAANDGYEFIGWYENDELISEDTELSFKAEADRDLVALFKVVGEEVETVTITVSANPAAGGSATGGGTYDKGADVALTATANSGYRFVGWFEGGVSVSATAAYTFEAASDRTLEARFEVVSGGTQNPGGGGPGGGGSTGNVTPASPAPTIIEAPEEEPPLGAAEPEPEFLLRLDKDRTEGYIHGYPDGTFGPNNNITRYETAVMFYNLVKDPDKASFTSAVEKFSDVPTDQWFSEAVGYLVTRGVLLGYPDGEFKGDNNITRAEFVTIASKFDETSLLDDISFPDVDDSHWAYDYIKSAYNNHWITGYPDGTFGPENMITRAEAVVIINRMLEWDPAEAKGENPFSDIEPGDWYYNDVLLAANGR